MPTAQQAAAAGFCFPALYRPRSQYCTHGSNVYFEGPASGIDLYVDDANVYGQVPAGTNPNATGQINLANTHQTLDGFGGAGAWYEGSVISIGNSNPNIYNILFRDLGLDIYRVRNTYNIDNGYITRSAQIIAAGQATLGHPLRIINTSWSPPSYLKSNGSTVGGTLAKDGNGNYRYADFAQWWADSLTAWSNASVDSYYVNMQNEPQWTASWDTCLFGLLKTTLTHIMSRLLPRCAPSLTRSKPTNTPRPGRSGYNLHS